MKEDESKTANQEQQPQAAESVATVETPDTDATPGTDMDGHADNTPQDGEGCEAVTVVILEENPQHGQLVARSVRQNLIGVDAQVVRIAPADGGTMAQALQRFASEMCPTERLLVMTDEMLLLNPTTLYEAGCRRGVLTDKGVTLDENRTPKLMHRSVLRRLLPELTATHAGVDILLEYHEQAAPSVMPVIVRHWKEDGWLLPVVSSSPRRDVLEQWARTKRFAWIAPQSWTPEVIAWLEDRFPA